MVADEHCIHIHIITSTLYIGARRTVSVMESHMEPNIKGSRLGQGKEKKLNF